MTQVITIERVTPIPRYDSLAWTHARIEESTTQDGAYTTVEEISLATLPGGLDSDPTQPAARNLTTEDASDGDIWVRVVFVDANDDESAATTPIFTGTPSNLYVTTDELKVLLSVPGESYADEAIDIAVAAARDAINGYTGMRFHPTTETRYYTAEHDDFELPVDEINTVTTLTIDRDGDGTYSETWAEDTDYYLEPANAALEGRPYTSLVIRDQSGRRFPPYQRNIKLVGSFGWATTPPGVKQAAVLLANRFLTRTKAAPLGIATVVANEMVAAAHLGSIDKDAAFLLDKVMNQATIGSLQLG